MPLVINLYGYVIYFWSAEMSSGSLEPVHVHVAKKTITYGNKILDN